MTECRAHHPVCAVLSVILQVKPQNPWKAVTSVSASLPPECTASCNILRADDFDLNSSRTEDKRVMCDAYIWLSHEEHGS